MGRKMKKKYSIPFLIYVWKNKGEQSQNEVSDWDFEANYKNMLASNTSYTSHAVTVTVPVELDHVCTELIGI